MNREIMFRGKSVDNGEWVYGYLVKKIDPIYTDIEYYHILHQGKEKNGMLKPLVTWTRVAPETVGQFTGLTDEDGMKIFEGDILIYQEDEYGKITYSDNEAMFCIEFDTWSTDFDRLNVRDLGIVGNIHDNPEILKGEENE